jgi:hypothetical protein
MPQPRLSTVLGAVGSSSFAAKGVFGAAGSSAFASDATSSRATVIGVVSDYSNTYYCDFNGFTIRATATIDAAIQVGDAVWVQKSSSGYVITGTL